MELKIRQVTEIIIIISIIIFSSYSIYTTRNKAALDMSTLSFSGLQDSEFSIITKADATNIKNIVKDGHIGYISDTDCNSSCTIYQQYILAPLFIDYSNTNHTYAFGTFSSNDKAVELSQANNLDIIRQNGTFYLFKAKQ